MMGLAASGPSAFAVALRAACTRLCPLRLGGEVDSQADAGHEENHEGVSEIHPKPDALEPPLQHEDGCRRGRDAHPVPAKHASEGERRLLAAAFQAPAEACAIGLKV